jgi:hypothetical protein
MIVCLRIKGIVLEPMYEDFQDEVYEDFQDQVYKNFKTKCTRTPIFSFQSNEASVLEHIAPIYTFLSIPWL